MTKKLGIFGASGFAREVADIAFELGYEPFLIVRDQSEFDKSSASIDAVRESDLVKRSEMSFALGIGENGLRKKIVQRYEGKLSFVNLIHPSATFGKDQRRIMDNCRGIIICAGVRFTNNIIVGDFSIFNLNSTIGHDCIVEDFVNVAPGANISGNVHLGSCSWIGTGAAINQGYFENKIYIGKNTTIGSGSVVTASCLDDSIYVGVPAKRIR